jgi:hypothetical protein
MAKKHDIHYFLKKINAVMREIEMTPRENVFRFRILKKRAERLVEQAKKEGLK